MKMKLSLLRLSIFLFLFVCSSFNASAEIIVGSSLEWLTVSSKIVAVGKIISVEKFRGGGSIVYETYVFEPSEIIKGAGQKKKINFTVRTYSTEPVSGKPFDPAGEVIVFLSDYENDGEKFLQGRLVPSNMQFPLSIVNLNETNKYLIDLNFKVLKNKDDVLEVCRQTVKAQTAYQNRNPAAPVKRFYLEVPMGSEAFASLYGGSTCYLFVPNFMSPNAKETIFRTAHSGLSYVVKH